MRLRWSRISTTCPGRRPGIESAGGVGQHDDAGTGDDGGAHGMDHLGRRPALVEVGAPEQRQHLAVAHVQGPDRPLVPGHGRRHEARRDRPSGIRRRPSRGRPPPAATPSRARGPPRGGPSPATSSRPRLLGEGKRAQPRPWRDHGREATGSPGEGRQELARRRRAASPPSGRASGRWRTGRPRWPRARSSARGGQRTGPRMQKRSTISSGTNSVVGFPGLPWWL